MVGCGICNELLILLVVLIRSHLCLPVMTAIKRVPLLPLLLLSYSRVGLIFHVYLC